VIAFRGAFKLDVVLTVPYLITLGFSLIVSAFGVLELYTSSDIVLESDAPLRPTVVWLLRGLTIFVLLLAVGGFLAGIGGLSTTGKIFPEPLTLFSVRAFAAFYLALVVGLSALLLRPGLRSGFTLGLMGVSLIIPILAAALLNIWVFDLIERPLGLLYLAAYILVLGPSAWFLWQHREAF
jgi:hypothetical protein